MLKQIHKVYGFGSGFYSALYEAQKKQHWWFTFFLYFCAIIAFFVSSLLVIFVPEDRIITKIEFRVYFICAIVMLYIILHYMNRMFVVERNNIYDILTEEPDRECCDGKVTDFWLAKEMTLRGFQYVFYVIIQIEYKGRPIKHKIAYPVSHIPSYRENYAIYDMVVKNLYFLYHWLCLGITGWTPPPDNEVKHAFHKSLPNIIRLGKKAHVFMHKKNIYLPYTDLDAHDMINPPSTTFFILDTIRKSCLLTVHLYLIWLLFSYVFAILLGILMLLGM